MKKITILLCVALSMPIMISCSTNNPPSATKAPSESPAASPAATKAEDLSQADTQIDYSDSGSIKEGSTIRFKSVTTEGEEIESAKLFADYDLTLINFWGTFCKPCVTEMPELQKISQKYDNVNVLGIIIDVNSLGSKGLIKAKAVMEATGATFKSVVTNQDMSNGICSEVQAVPTTLFVDKNGVVIGDYIEGAMSETKFDAHIENRLAKIKGE